MKAYQEEILKSCQKGKACDYGICDECPNIIEFSRSIKDDDEEE